MAGDSEIISQDDIEELLRQAQAAAHAPATPSNPPPPQAPTAVGNNVDQSEIEALLRQSSEAAAQSAASAGTSQTVGQAEIDALLRSGNARSAATAAQAATGAARPQSTQKVTDDISFLLNQAEAALASVDQPTVPDLEGLAPFELREFGGTPASSEKATLELLRDVELDVKIELGRSNMYLEEVLRLRRGSVVTLDKLAGDPVDIYVNGRLIARGEVLVLNDNFCVRVAELLSGEEPKAA
jgi:flagellar motor switch protein FliN/FliY